MTPNEAMIEEDRRMIRKLVARVARYRKNIATAREALKRIAYPKPDAKKYPGVERVIAMNALAAITPSK